MTNMCDLMPKSNHVTIKIPKELIEKIDRLVGKEGFRSRGEIAKVALRKLLDSYKELITPVLEHFNIDENEGCVRVMDHAKEIIADVYFSYKGVKCKACNSQKCEHVKYALNLPKVVNELRRHGWEIEDGEIIRKP